ncbi:hypothetical protein AM593_02862, partial [Mytilus galloprovincialis]
MSFALYIYNKGIKVKYNLAKPVQQRVVEALAICQNCTIPAYEPIDANVMYSLILTNFIRNGGDGYTMIRDNAVQSHTIGDLEADVLMEYIKNASPFYNGIEGRIILGNSTETIDKLTCNDGKVITCDDVNTNTCDSLTCENGNVYTCDCIMNLKQYTYSRLATQKRRKRKRKQKQFCIGYNKYTLGINLVVSVCIFVLHRFSVHDVRFVFSFTSLKVMRITEILKIYVGQYKRPQPSKTAFAFQNTNIKINHTHCLDSFNMVKGFSGT